jgi:photosystem II protein
MPASVVSGGLGLGPRGFSKRERWLKQTVAQAGEEADEPGRPRVEFIPGVEETKVPDVRLTKSKDGTNGSAIFRFDNPDLFELTQSDITGMFLYDEEGELSTTDVKARFVDGNPVGIQAKYDEHVRPLDNDAGAGEACVTNGGKYEHLRSDRYNMRSPAEWDRFMRFMERYAEINDLGFRGGNDSS